MIIKKTLPFLLAVLASFIASGIFIAAMGYNVIDAYRTILFTSFRTTNGITQTLLKFSPLLLLALAYTIPLTAGKYNIGGGGQLIMGAVGAAIVGLIFSDLPLPILLPMTILAGLLLGALWGFIAGWLLYKFGINEILTTTLLNFVAALLIDYICTLPGWRDESAGHPTTILLGQGSFLPNIVDNPPLHAGVVLSVIIAGLIYVFIHRTTAGYDIIATGANPRAAKVFGIKVNNMFVLALLLGGAMGGLAGAFETIGVQHRLIVGLESNFQILGLMIGLISKGSLIAVPFVAFFISILEVGASAMQRTMMIPIEMVFIVEALVVIFVLMTDVIERRR